MDNGQSRIATIVVVSSAKIGLRPFYFVWPIILISLIFSILNFFFVVNSKITRNYSHLSLPIDRSGSEAVTTLKAAA